MLVTVNFCLLPLQELEKLEVERIEWIQQHLRQYTTLRHETDMFNQSVSPSSSTSLYWYWSFENEIFNRKQDKKLILIQIRDAVEVKLN